MVRKAFDPLLPLEGGVLVFDVVFPDIPDGRQANHQQERRHKRQVLAADRWRQQAGEVASEYAPGDGPRSDEAEQAFGFPGVEGQVGQNPELRSRQYAEDGHPQVKEIKHAAFDDVEMPRAIRMAMDRISVPSIIRPMEECRNKRL